MTRQSRTIRTLAGQRARGQISDKTPKFWHTCSMSPCEPVNEWCICVLFAPEIWDPLQPKYQWKPKRPNIWRQDKKLENASVTGWQGLIKQKFRIYLQKTAGTFRCWILCWIYSLNKPVFSINEVLMAAVLFIQWCLVMFITEYLPAMGSMTAWRSWGTL